MNQTNNRAANKLDQSQTALPTLMDHLQELKSRLFWVAVFFVFGAVATYPFFGAINHALLKPIGKEELYYTSPAGGIGFIIKVCMYAGFIVMLPAFIYHLYRFIAPAMNRKHSRAVVVYTVSSVVLAATGVAFAYFISLPAALHFLTGIDLGQISPLITIDSYLSFISAYLLAGALLFQLPLIMLIINGITPLPPGKLMNYQRHMIVISFIIAAVVSPTPDVVNQTILAAPMIVMYQIGVLIVWLRQRQKAPRSQLHHPAVSKPVSEERRVQSVEPKEAPVVSVLQQAFTLSQPPASKSATVPPGGIRPFTTVPQPTRRSVRRTIDGIVPRQPAQHASHTRPATGGSQLAGRPQRRDDATNSGSIDGVLSPAPGF